MKYIHYGSNNFDPEKFIEIENMHLFNKPIGGLWASCVKAKFGWSKWGQENNYGLSDLKKSFTFSLSPDARIYEINSKEDIEALPLQEEQFSSLMKAVDFESLCSDYDVIKFNYDNNPSLYWNLYGWDCDCILVLNKEVII